MQKSIDEANAAANANKANIVAEQKEAAKTSLIISTMDYNDYVTYRLFPKFKDNFVGRTSSGCKQTPKGYSLCVIDKDLMRSVCYMAPGMDTTCFQEQMISKAE